MYPNHGAVFASRDAFDFPSKMDKQKKTGKSSSKESLKKFGYSVKKGQSQKPVKSEGQLVTKVKKLDPKDCLDDDGVHLALKLVGDTVDGDDEFPADLEAQERIQKAEMAGAREIVQLGPTRAPVKTESTSFSDPGSDSTSASIPLKNLNLKRAVKYLDDDPIGQDYSQEDQLSVQSTSSSGTITDQISDLDEEERKTVAECTDLGIDPDAIKDRAGELFILFPGITGPLTGFEVMEAANKLIAHADDIPGATIVRYRIEDNRVIAELRKSYFVPKKKESNRIPKPTLLPIVNKTSGEVGSLKEPRPSTSGMRIVKVEDPFDEPVSSLQSNALKKFILVLPRRSGGKDIRLEIPVKFHDEIAETSDPPPILGVKIIREMGLYRRYMYAMNYDAITIIEE